MAAIHDLLAQIQDEALRNRIEQEVDRLSKTKKFGLVFEQHLPECTPLYDMPIKVGVKVMNRKAKEDKSIYVVLKIDEDNIVCGRKDNLQEQVSLLKEDVVRVAEFGEPIYPYLKPIDDVCNAPKDDLWHTLIEADNYHALQLLEYLYAGKVDCIYIDPPYNTGARDWKYNNDFVDNADSFRHSKWLSMMQKRLVLAKKLLKNTGIIIVTIDDYEYATLKLLMDEIFSLDNYLGTIVIRNNPSGRSTVRGLSVNHEYALLYAISDKARLGRMEHNSTQKSRYNEKDEVGYFEWENFRKNGTDSDRPDRPKQFYPIALDESKMKLRVPDCIWDEDKKEYVITEDVSGEIVLWPVAANGTEKVWKYGIDRAKSDASELLVKKTSGRYEVYRKKYLNTEGSAPHTWWDRPEYSARDNGTRMLTNILGNSSTFDFPKALEAVKDSLTIANLPKDGLVVDFFAGSGTTLQAVNLMNKIDGGKRRCILVTNNEVADKEVQPLLDKGYFPGSSEWEEHGVARSVTWKRTVCSIKGIGMDGKPLKGKYSSGDLPLDNGFEANVSFFKLGFLDKTAVALGLQFKEMLPVLWMKAGAVGKCPELGCDSLPDMVILPQNKFAVLVNENMFSGFAEEITKHPEIQTVYLITDYEVNYRSMAKNLGVATTYQLYRDYLDNFRINHGRNI